MNSTQNGSSVESKCSCPDCSDKDNGSEESSMFEEESDEAEQDDADCEALGIDLLRFLKKKEFTFYKDKLYEKIETLEEMIDILETRLDREVSEKEEQYSAGCAIIENRLIDHMKPVKKDIEILLKTRAR